MTSSAELSSAVTRILVTKDGKEVVTGTGFMIAPGMVLTAAHVVAGADNGRVLLGQKGQATLVAGNVTRLAPQSDLALIKVVDSTWAQPDPPDLSFDVLRNMADIFEQRYLQSSKQSDVDQVINLYRDLLAQVEDSDLSAVPMLSNLAAAHRFRYDLLRAFKDLDEAITCWRRALDVSRELGVPAAESAILSNLASALRTRAEVTGGPADLDEAVSMARRALQLAEGIGQLEEVPATLSNLAAALTTRSQVTGSADDLNNAVRLWRQAVELISDREPARAVVLRNLGAALESRFRLSGQVSDLHEALAWTREALAISAGGQLITHVETTMAAATGAPHGEGA